VLAARASACAAHASYLIWPHGTAPSIERRHAMKWLFDRTLNRGAFEGGARGRGERR
jgi:hypothetical protein